MKITEKIFDISTGQETIVERDETANEIAYREKAQADLEAQIAEAEAKAAQKTALLERLGITAEEAQLLLGGN